MGQGRVLVIDADRAEREGYTNTLAEAGYVVTESSREEAVRRVEEEAYDVVLTDDLALVPRVRTHAADTPIILISAHLDNKTAIRASAAGALHCLQKPIEPEALRETTEQAMRRRRAKLAALERIDAEAFPATTAKNEFGRVLDTVMQKGMVVITKHDAPKAVLLSLDEFEALTDAGRTTLVTLRAEFDSLLDRMQAPRVRAGMKAAFSASPAALGKAAVAGARKRR